MLSPQGWSMPSGGVDRAHTWSEGLKPTTPRAGRGGRPSKAALASAADRSARSSIALSPSVLLPHSFATGSVPGALAAADTLSTSART